MYSFMFLATLHSTVVTLPKIQSIPHLLFKLEPSKKVFTTKAAKWMILLFWPRWLCRFSFDFFSKSEDSPDRRWCFAFQYTRTSFSWSFSLTLFSKRFQMLRKALLVLLAQSAWCTIYLQETFDDGKSLLYPTDSWKKRWISSTFKSDYGKMIVSSGAFYADETFNRGQSILSISQASKHRNRLASTQLDPRFLSLLTISTSLLFFNSPSSLSSLLIAEVVMSKSWGQKQSF